ncbi:hypothetical protein QBC39DRAFT_345642, partial [Podospora conica]
MDESRRLRLHMQKLLVKHEQQRLQYERQRDSLLKHIQLADARDQENLRILDSLLDRPEPELRYVMKVFLDKEFVGSQRLQGYLDIIRPTPDLPSTLTRDADEPRVKRVKREDDGKGPLDTILEAPEDELRALLKVILMASDGLLAPAWKILQDKFLPPGVPCTPEMMSYHNLVPRATDVRLKRAALVDDVNWCDKCEQVFLETDNIPGKCVYHPQGVEINRHSRAWDDWVDSKHGEKTELWVPEENPNGFWYTCCRSSLEDKSPGCRKERHWSRIDPRGPHGWMESEIDASLKAAGGGSARIL